MVRKKSTRQKWISKFETKLKSLGKKKPKILASKMVDKASRALVSMKSRSMKYKVKCDIKVEDLYSMLYDAIGTTCKYDSNRLLIYNNMVFDHKVPISKGGESTVDNIQVISKTSNTVKGSLTEDEYYQLLGWLSTLPRDFSENIRIRLAGGKR